MYNIKCIKENSEQGAQVNGNLQALQYKATYNSLYLDLPKRFYLKPCKDTATVAVWAYQERAHTSTALLYPNGYAVHQTRPTYYK